MKVGDLVTAIRAIDLKAQIGMIIKHKPLAGHILEAFEVLTSDGKIDTYTTAALREVPNESR